MTLTGLGGWGPEANDWRMQQNNTSDATKTGWSFPTTTDDAASPPDGSRWIKVIDTATAQAIFPTEDFTADNYVWLCARGIRVRGTISSGDPTAILIRVQVTAGGTSFFIRRDRVSDSSYKFTADQGAFSETGSEVVNTDTTANIRAQWDGTNFRLWVNGVLDIQAAYTSKPVRTQIDLYPPDSSQQHYFSRGLLCMSDSESDRPNTSVEMGMLQGNDNWASEQDYGDQADCTGADGVYGDTTLDGSDQVDTSVYWCEEGGAAGQQMNEMETDTFTGTIVFAKWCAVQTTNVAAKTVDTNARLSDGTTAIEKANANLSSTDWVSRHKRFPDPPGGGTWESDIASLKCGVSSPNTNGANDHLAALMLEVYAVGNDPPPAISPNKGFGQVIG